jgi:hypothetical protein
MSKKEITINDFLKDGLIKRLMKAGIISANRAIYFRYYECVQVYVSQGFTKTKAVDLTADENRTDSRTVWRALKAISLLETLE